MNYKEDKSYIFLWTTLKEWSLDTVTWNKNIKTWVKNKNPLIYDVITAQMYRNHNN